MNERKLPWDVKQQALWIVRGYDRARREYLKQRREILDAGGGGNGTTYLAEIGRGADGKPKYEERRAFLPASHNASRTAENIAIQLAALENTQSFRQMRAVEHARDHIGADMPDGMADALKDAIMLNCQDGRKYRFEYLFLSGISRSGFYRIRDSFFREIAEELGLF